MVARGTDAVVLVYKFTSLQVLQVFIQESHGMTFVHKRFSQKTHSMSNYNYKLIAKE